MFVQGYGGIGLRRSCCKLARF